MSETLSQYVITCLTESMRITTDYRPTPPTCCPNNNTHTIDPTQTQVYTTKPMTDVQVLQPNGYYQCSTLDLDMPACTPGTIFSADLVNPMRVLLWTTSMFLPADSEGDRVEIIAAPDTPIGYITASISVDATVIPVSATVIGFLIPGLDIALYDGVNYHDLGRVISIDAVNGTVTIEYATISSFAIGTPVLFNLKNVRAFDVCRDFSGEINLGGAWIKYKEVPPNTTMRVVYTNNDGVAKCVVLKFEYYIVQPTGLVYD